MFSRPHIGLPFFYLLAAPLIFDDQLELALECWTKRTSRSEAVLNVIAEVLTKPDIILRAKSSSGGMAPIKQSASSTFTIDTALSFDPATKSFVRNLSFEVDERTGLITKVHQRGKFDTSTPEPNDFDLRSHVVLPGLVDAHTHIFLHSYEEASAYNQIVHESFVERIIRATNHCRAALLAGYTTYRDLGTEGMQDADIGLRDSINRGLIPGPRLFVATEPLSSSGGYVVQHENRLGGVSVPAISDIADGVNGVRSAVRRRLGAGADIIKFYADEEKRNPRYPAAQWSGATAIQFPPQEEAPRFYTLFTAEEMKAIVDEAKDADCPVAVHASSPEGMIRAANAGATTIEHGQTATDEALKAMQTSGCMFVPTLAIMEAEMPPEPFADHLVNVKKAWQMGIKLACGGDIGPIAHGENARELELMMLSGIPVEEVLTAATLNGYEACGGDECGRQFGRLAVGCAADFIALKDDPRENVEAFRQVDFVMKDGKVYKKDGQATW